jgi:hypothetical protein
MKSISGKLLQSLGIGVVIVFHSLYPLMSPSRMVYYHSSVRMRSVVLACIADIILGAAGYWLLRTGLRRARAWRGGQFVIACIAPWMLFILDPTLLYSIWRHLKAHLAEASRHPGNYMDTTMPLGVRYAILLAWIVVLLALAWGAPRIYRKVMTAGGIVLTGMGIFALLGSYTLVQAWRWQPEVGQSVPWHPHAAGEAHPRIVWVLFDELSYAQTYEQRPAGLQLPNFDSLAAQSTVYTDARPIGYWTEMVLPSLFLGRTVDAVRASPAKRLLIGNGNGTSILFPTDQSLTAEAQRAGWNVGIDGWYNPYCSILSGTFQKCQWSDREDPSGPMITAATVRQNMILGAVDQLRTVEGDLSSYITQSEDETLFRRADELLQDESLDFVFIHIPLPHPPGAWDRQTETWARFSPGYEPSYEDNLALTDRELGRILKIAEASPRWSKTTLLVQGDHSWRVGIWRTTPLWSSEDERISHGGRFDDRPALIVHAAGQTSAVKVDAPTSLMFAHTLLHNVLAQSSAGR